MPLVVSVHSIVGLDFAASLMPGWQETIFPPYFVVGALFSGFAMVVMLTALVRWGFGLQALITVNHFDAMAKIVLLASIIMSLSYATEWFMGWYGGSPVERSLVSFFFTGAYAPLYWAMLACNCLIPQALWLPARPPQHLDGRADLDRHQCRHVAGAHPDHLEHALARLLPCHVAAVLPDALGLAAAVRAARASSRSCSCASSAWFRPCRCTRSAPSAAGRALS